MMPKPTIFAGWAAAAGALALCGLAAAAAQPRRAAEGATQANKRVVLSFYEAGLNRKVYAEAVRFLGERYVQHNPTSDDGRKGFAKFVGFLRANYPYAHSTVRQAFAEGDFVILHVFEKLQPGDRGNAIVDIFRLERGRIVEHWDVKQPIPNNPANRNGMF